MEIWNCFAKDSSISIKFVVVLMIIAMVKSKFYALRKFIIAK